MTSEIYPAVHIRFLIHSHKNHTVTDIIQAQPVHVLYIFRIPIAVIVNLQAPALQAPVTLIIAIPTTVIRTMIILMMIIRALIVHIHILIIATVIVTPVVIIELLPIHTRIVVTRFVMIAIIRDQAHPTAGVTVVTLPVTVAALQEIPRTITLTITVMKNVITVVSQEDIAMCSVMPAIALAIIVITPER